MNHQYNPPLLDFVDCIAPIEHRYQQIVAMLNDYECVINFTKINGESRTMNCTLRDDQMPTAAQIINEDVMTPPSSYETITVWCTDKKVWRSMKTANVTNVKIAPKSWTVTIEEDPETGETVFPLPAELLSAQGWQEGDILDWQDNGDGSWSLTKVK